MSDWSPAYHTEADEPDNEPAKGPTVAQREGKTEQKAENKSAVGLTLNLPPEFISAMWGYGDQVMRLAIAVEENTKAIRELMGDRHTGTEGGDPSGGQNVGRPSAPAPRDESGSGETGD